MSDYYYYDGGYYEPDVGIAFAGLGIQLLIFGIATLIATVSYWKLLSKAGKPGWAILIPFYGSYKMFETTFGVGYGYLTFLPLATIIINFIPILGQIVSIIVYVLYLFVFPVMFAKRYGAGNLLAIGILFLPAICLPILAFSSVYQYMGPIGAGPFGLPPIGGKNRDDYNGYNGQNGYYNGQNNFNGYAGGQVPNSNWNGNYSQPNQAGQPNGWGQNPQGQRMNLGKNDRNSQGQGFGQNVQGQNMGRNFGHQGNYGPQGGYGPQGSYGPQGGYGPQGSYGQNQRPMGQNPNQMGQRPQGEYTHNPGQGQMGQRPQNFNGYNQNNGYRQ